MLRGSFLLSTALFSLAAASDSCSGTTRCMLLDDGVDGWGCTKQPTPSLSQCYKHNQEACCVSHHDSEVASEYSDLLSGTCIRSYNDLEHYYCLGCNPKMDSYVTMFTPSTSYAGRAESDTTALDTALCYDSSCEGRLNVCASFAEALMFAEPGTSSMVGDIYDNCGLGGLTGNTDNLLPSAYFYTTAKAQLEAGQDFRGRNHGTAGFITKADAMMGYGGNTNGATLCAADPCTSAEIQARAKQIFFDLLRPTFFPRDKFVISFDTAGSSGCFSPAGRATMSILLAVVSAAFAFFSM